MEPQRVSNYLKILTIYKDRWHHTNQEISIGFGKPIIDTQIKGGTE